MWSVNRLRPDPPGQDQRFNVMILGSGFFVAPHLFLTCHHVLNSTANPHRAGDRYQIVQSLSLTQVKMSPHLALVVDADLHLYPDYDAALVQVAWDPQPHAAVSYSDVFEGEEIGVAGYPLPQMLTIPNGGQPMVRFVFRVAKGVITSTLRQGLRPTGEPPTAEFQTVEVNFLFAPGNSGGPISNLIREG